MNKKGIIDEEQLYPIYSITIKWTQEISSKHPPEKWDREEFSFSKSN